MSASRVRVSKNASTKKGEQLTQEIQQLISRHGGKIISKALNRRPVFLGKYLDATQGRRDQTRRKQVFAACIELMQRTGREHVSYNPQGVELLGLTANDEKIGVHIREEIDAHGNRRLFLISTFRGNAADGS